MNLNSASSDRHTVVSVRVDDDVSIGVSDRDCRSDNHIACGGKRCGGRRRDRCVDDRVLTGTIQRDIPRPNRDDRTRVDRRFIDGQQPASPSRRADVGRSCNGQVSSRCQFNISTVNVWPD